MNSQPNEQWEVYVASYENGNPGSTTLRMDLIDYAPIERLKYILITGTTYETSRDDGFPENETFEKLHKIGDELLELVMKETESILAGSFTHKKERLEYFYIKENNGLKEKLEKYYEENYPNTKYYVTIEEDEKWEYYTEFLYPNEEVLNYMGDESVIRNLQKSGDNLTKERRVDHWLYFSSELDMVKCKSILLKEDFKIEKAGTNKGTNLLYELQIWRIDYVDIGSIYPITSKLREIAEKNNGEYDGWETSVVKD